MPAPIFGIDFVTTQHICPLCDKPIQFDDLVFVGKPKETAMCYWCFKEEILGVVKSLFLETTATYDENNTPHVWVENKER